MSICGSHSVHYPMASMGSDVESFSQMHMNPSDFHAYHMLPVVFTHPLWTLQQTSMAEVISSH